MSDLQQALALLAQYTPRRASSTPAPATLYHGSSRITGGLPEWLVPRVIQAESGGNPRAVSPAGAMGLMQLMPATAQRFGVRDPFDPEQNRRAGTEYLAWLYRRYGGSLPLAVAAYHAGEGNVDRYLQGRPSGVGPRTRGYVQKVLGVSL